MTNDNTHDRAVTRRTFAGLGVAAGAALDSSGRITIRGGGTPTDVIIDRIGWLI